MKKNNNTRLNEGIQDLVGGVSSSSNDFDVFATSGKKKKKSLVADLWADEEESEIATQQPKNKGEIVEEITDTIFAPENLIVAEQKQTTKKDNTLGNVQIVVPQTIEETIMAKNLERTKNKQKSVAEKEILNTASQIQLTPQTISLTVDKTDEEKNQQLVEIYNDTTGADLDNVDMVEIRDNVIEAINEIPDAIGEDITDFEIKPIDKKDKSGYYKVNVGVRGSEFPAFFSKIASYIKQHSKGVISHRRVDLRVIGNTNKTQLRGSILKLSKYTLVFKPNPDKLKVNKGTRIMISVPENENNIIVYLQESRAKHILEIEGNNFPTENHLIEFIGDRIAEYYIVGYKTTLSKLLTAGQSTPLVDLCREVLKTGRYKGKPIMFESDVYGLSFITKGVDNQWLIINILEHENVPNKFVIMANNKIDASFEYDIIGKPVTIDWLNKNLIKMLDEMYKRDWSKELDIVDEYDTFLYLLGKMKHSKLRNVAIEIRDKGERDKAMGVEILKTASRNDMENLLKDDYDAEAIIGKTNSIDYFIVTYLAYPIVGGDRRKGRDYITREEYYEKYDVKDKRQYDERENTVIKRQANERNYNARIYLFQVEVIKGDNKYIYRDKSFEKIAKETDFLGMAKNLDVKIDVQ